jgi:hypothetical protein
MGGLVMDGGITKTSESERTDRAGRAQVVAQVVILYTKYKGWPQNDFNVNFDQGRAIAAIVCARGLWHGPRIPRGYPCDFSRLHSCVDRGAIHGSGGVSGHYRAFRS